MQVSVGRLKDPVPKIQNVVLLSIRLVYFNVFFSLYLLPLGIQVL